MKTKIEGYFGGPVTGGWLIRLADNPSAVQAENGITLDQPLIVVPTLPVIGNYRGVLFNALGQPAVDVTEFTIDHSIDSIMTAHIKGYLNVDGFQRFISDFYNQ